VTATGAGGTDAVSVYATMTLVREFERRALELRTGGEIIGPVHPSTRPPVHPSIGQEAIAVGVCAVIEERDTLVSHYRGHGHLIARGTPLRRWSSSSLGFPLV
jgi:TPP-dependent pyruvate/acetoin dehydrogenase alpha subunit